MFPFFAETDFYRGLLGRTVTVGSGPCRFYRSAEHVSKNDALKSLK